MAAPKLESVKSILEGYSLPLLVQRKSGERLLVHKSVIIPYVICQGLDADVLPDNEYFLIPLSNKGYYGTVSPHDEPTKPFTCLSQILTSGTNSAKVLVNSQTPVKLLNSSTDKFEKKVIPSGQIIPISNNRSCPHLTHEKSSALCCFSSKPSETADNTVCVRDNSKHFHIDKHVESRFYCVNQGGEQEMRDGTVSTVQSIAQHQSLPKMVCRVLTNPMPQDELPVPKMFRLIKIINDRVLVAYKLSESNHPRPGDVIELSSYSQEMLAVAESCRVNMDDIRQHHVSMSIRRVHPGKTLSHEDFHEIVRKSRNLPPILPERPSTLILKSNSSTTFLSPNNGVVNDTEQEVLKLSDVQGRTTPTRSASHTVRLPTRDTSNRSILKRFSSVSARKDTKHPSMKDILNNFHKKDDENNNLKRKSKQSLRGKEIVHILPDAQPVEAVDLRKPFLVDLSPSVISTSSSTSSLQHSPSLNNAQQSGPNEFRKNIDSSVETHQSSSYDRSSSAHSQGSSAHSQVSSSHNQSAYSLNYQSGERKTSTRNSVRFSDIVLEEVKDSPTYAELALVPASSAEPPIPLPSPDYEEPASYKTLNHLDEIRQRFNSSSTNGLKPSLNGTALASPTTEGLELDSPPPKVPHDPIEELKFRLSTNSLKPLAKTQRDFSKPPTNTTSFISNRKRQPEKSASNSLPGSGQSAVTSNEDSKPTKFSATIKLTG